MLNSKAIRKLPQGPGVYQFFDKTGQLLYVGKSNSIRKRVSSYYNNRNLGPKTEELKRRTVKVSAVKVFSEFEALLLEAELIRENQPFFNIVAKDDKSPLYIKISKGPVPILSVTRRQKPEPGVFLKGPFPSAKTTRQVLRNIRRIFPYCHHKSPKKPCLFVHLGLCPYPYKDEQAKREYKKTINFIKKLLSGNTSSLVRSLFSEIQNYAKEQQFEEAQKIKKQIEEIEYVTTSFHQPDEFIRQPSLVDDLTLAKLKDLAGELNLEKLPRRIECFDISNISGKLATGSMVVFTNGQPDKGQYRRFRIKFTNKVDDFAMMREVLGRRLKNNWQIPDLIVIDGGKGQLMTAYSQIIKERKTIPVVSLAKRLEEIYMPGHKEPISLPKESPSRQLVQAIRDEAHRFAIAYHKLLRSKNVLPR